MNDTEKAYLAGLFDGDGSLHMSKHFDKNLGRENVIPVVNFSMQSKETLKWVAARINAKVEEETYGRRAFTCRITGWKKVIPVIQAIQPYVITKRAQVTFMIWARDVLFSEARSGGWHVILNQTKLELRLLAYEIMCLLNKRDSMTFSGKSGEFSENLKSLLGKVMATTTLSQASEGTGSEEGATTNEVSPNNNPQHERPTLQ